MLCLALFFTSCGDDYIPKPRAFYRINYPEHQYRPYVENCPFQFEYPTYTDLIPDMKGDQQLCWMNVHYSNFNANLHLSYKPIFTQEDLIFLLKDSYTFVDKHNVKAEQISEQYVGNGKDAHGLLFSIGGNTASSVQFFLTDSTQNFIRGSLYFNCQPNKDSLAPVIDFIKKDVEHLIETFEWRR